MLSVGVQSKFRTSPVKEGAVPLLQWRDEYEIGIGSIDHEHHALIDLINLLGARLDPKFGVVEVCETLGEIHTLIAAHFAHEESIMRELHYDQYAEHKAEHDRLLNEIRDILHNVDAGTFADYRAHLGERVGR
jgi:hemerythrin-like metal-binding protein